VPPRRSTQRSVWLRAAVWLRGAATAASACWVAACGGGAGVYCHDLCKALEGCTANFSINACRTACRDGAVVDAFADEYLVGIASCYRSATCEELRTDDALLPCFEDAGQELNPRAECYAFCETGSSKAFECGGGFSVAECVEGVCPWSNATLERATACYEGSTCENRDICLDEAFTVE
jgi:hypothetical protein